VIDVNVLELNLEGKVAVVTGGGTGLGRAIAVQFAKAGAHVAVASRNLVNLNKVVEEIKGLGTHSLAIRTDISKKADVDNMLQAVISEFGSIDVLVNNAAIINRGSLLDIPEDKWDETIDINLKGYFLCCQIIGRKMVELKRGNIVNIASLEGLKVSMAKNSVYGISKAGVFMMTKVLARELGNHNIRVNSVAPGLIKVERNEYLWGVPSTLMMFEEETALGRIGEPIDVANAALFLASDAAKHITGQTIIVDGGASL
jgi:NAD(P)-dependent dehydrogenase (short-subunit alcohol dehydrogenase family)